MIYVAFINVDTKETIRDGFLEHVPREGEVVQLNLSEDTYAIVKILNLIVDSQQTCGIYLKKVHKDG